MAGTPSDMVYINLLKAEEYRRTVEKLDIFNAGSAGTIVLESDPARAETDGGDNYSSGRWAPISSLVSRREEGTPATAATVTNLAMTSGLNVRQLLGLGPTAITDIQVRKGGRKFSMESAMVNLGQQFADAKLLNMRNNIIAAADAAVDVVSAHVLDVATGKTAGSKVLCSMSYINQMLALMGDAREQIKAFVMPSAVFADLVGSVASTYLYDSVSGITLYKDVIPAYGRAVIVADVPGLTTELTSSYHDEYAVLGLGVGAISATIIYDSGTAVWRDYDGHSPATKAREDYDVEFDIFGMKWDDAETNPTDAELATTANWATEYDDHRQFKVVKGIFNAGT